MYQASYMKFKKIRNISAPAGFQYAVAISPLEIARDKQIPAFKEVFIFNRSSSALS